MYAAISTAQTEDAHTEAAQHAPTGDNIQTAK